MSPSAPVQRLHGIHCVREALRARRRRLDRVLVRRGRRESELEGIRTLASEARVPVVEVEPGALGSGPGPGGVSQGVALEAGPLPEPSLEEALAPGGLGRPPERIVALDGVEDPQNVGAIIRVCEAAAVDLLVLTQRRAPPLGPALARASAGAVEWLPVARVGNLRSGLKVLKQEGFWVVGLDPGSALSLYEADDAILRGRLVLLLGAEGRGLRPSIREEVDHGLRIPMAGRVASLNVASTAAVVLFELGRRTHTSPPRSGTG